MILLETESDMHRHIIKHIGVHIYNVLAKPCDKCVVIERNHNKIAVLEEHLTCTNTLKEISHSNTRSESILVDHDVSDEMSRFQFVKCHCKSHAVPFCLKYQSQLGHVNI